MHIPSNRWRKLSEPTGKSTRNRCLKQKSLIQSHSSSGLCSPISLSMRTRFVFFLIFLQIP